MPLLSTTRRKAACATSRAPRHRCGATGAAADLWAGRRLVFRTELHRSSGDSRLLVRSEHHVERNQ